jgi:hypothetical protein
MPLNVGIESVHSDRNAIKLTCGGMYNTSGASDNVFIESRSYFSQKACQLISVVVTST